MKRVLFLIPFFGKLPVWFPLYLETCARNPFFDFLMVGDAKPEVELPPNFKYHPMKLSEFNDLATLKTGVKTQIQNGAKVCDFRPALGEILSEICAPYEFWAYTELDIFFGKLDNFITEKVLDSYDFISAAKNFVAGPMSIFRNTSKVNAVYKKSPDFREVFADSQLRRFEEVGRAHWDFRGSYKKIDTLFSFTDVIKAEIQKGELRILMGLNYFNDPDICWKEKGSALWKNGQITLRDGEEVSFYHFQAMKRWIGQTADILPTESFIISRYGLMSPNKKIRSFLASRKNYWNIYVQDKVARIEKRLKRK